MKKTDIAMIVLIAGISVFASYFIARATPLGNPASATVEVRVTDPIEEGLAPITATTFPKDGINPSVDIYIDDEQGSTEASPESEANGES